MKFTDRYVQKIKPRGSRFEVLESDGLTLRISPTGVKSWYYIYKLNGRNKRLHLGTYPHCSLAEARERHRAALSQRHDGKDPALEKRLEKKDRLLSPTVEDLTRDYLTKYAEPNKRSWKNDEQIINADVLPAWRHRKAADIRRRDVILLLESVLERGSPNQSGQVLKIVRRMFNWAIEQDVLESSPCHLVKPLAASQSKERSLTDDEIRKVWTALHDPDLMRMSSEMRRGLLLILVTGQRPGECLGLTRAEIDGDWWNIPAERTKNKRPHRVWLSATAMTLIGKGKKGPVFPGRAGETVGKAAPATAIRRLVKPLKKGARPRLPVDPFTPHDLRRTCATQLGGMGYSNEQIGRLLNHVDGSVTAVYNRHKYDSLVKEMLESWEAKVLGIINAKTEGACLPLN